MTIAISGLWDYRTTSLGAQALSDGMRAKLSAVWPDEPVIELHNENLFPGCSTLLRLAEGKQFLCQPLLKLLQCFYRLRFPGRAKAIHQSDLLIINGDGIVGDQFTYHTTLLTLDICAATAFGVRAVSLNQSVNITRGSLAYYCVKNHFLHFPIAVRENESLRYLREEFGRNDVMLCVDSAFVVPPLSGEETQRYANELADLKKKYRFDEYVVVGVRANRPRTQRIEERAWADIIRAAATIFQRPVILASSTPLYDIPLARRLRTLAGEGIVLEELMDWQRFNYRFFLHFLRNAFVSISDRYHQNVFAALVGTPFVPVEGNTSKTLGLKTLLHGELSVLPLPTAGNLNDYYRALRWVQVHHEATRQHLQKAVPQMCARYDRYSEILNAARTPILTGPARAVRSP